MRIKKFQGETMDKVLSQIKAEFGSDALILSSQNKTGRWFNKPAIEVTAAKAESPEATSGKTKEKSKEAGDTSEFNAAELERIFPHRKWVVPSGPSQSGDPKSAVKKEAPKPIRDSQHTARVFEECGFSHALSTELVRMWNERHGSDGGSISISEALRFSTFALQSQIKVWSPSVFRSRRNWAIVGGPGVGKTTLAAKVALFLKRDNIEVALMSRDNRKILARGELHAYAEVLNVPYVEDMGEGVPAHAVLIADTPALHWIEPEVVQEFEGRIRDLNCMLVLDATQKVEDLVLQCERAAQLAPLAVCFTKLDLVLRPTELLEVLYRCRLPLFALSNSPSFSKEIVFPDVDHWAKHFSEFANKKDLQSRSSRETSRGLDAFSLGSGVQS